MVTVICTSVGEKIDEPVIIQADFNKLLLNVSENIKKDKEVKFVVLTKI